MRSTGVIIASLLALCMATSARPNASRPRMEAGDNARASTDSVKAEPSRRNAVVVYYFHGDIRCAKCIAIERDTEEALRAGFEDEMETGKLVWRPVNVDREENEHYIKDYELVSRSVVLSELREGKEVRWGNLPDIWRLAGKREAFAKYIQENVREYLKGVL